MLKQYKLKDYNFRLVLWLCSLSAIGVLLVGSADTSLELRQLGGVILGLTVMLILSLVDFSWILNFYWLIYAGNIVLLLTVILSSFGRNAKGATRWLTIFGFSFQPVELSKILLILFFAKYFMEHENDLNRFTTVLRSILLIGLPLVLIAMQPDLKNTLTVLAVFCILYYVAGISYRYIAGVVLLVVPLAVIFMVIVTQPNSGILREYQRERIMAFLNPDNDEYSEDVIQQNNSVTAIGSGQLSGKGLNNEDVSSANKGQFIAERQNDFIFAVAGEELGFLGSAGIVILLLLIELECLLTSRRAKDLSGRIICTGVGSVVALQSFINIGVATHILPNTGTPLPFVSYGLTSIVSLFIGMGVVLNVGLQSRIVIPESGKRSRRQL